MLESASGSLPSYPGHPPAANEGLMSLVPDFILGPRKALDFGELRLLDVISRQRMEDLVFAPGPRRVDGGFDDDVEEDDA